MTKISIATTPAPMPSGTGSQSHSTTTEGTDAVKDPVCGMTVDPHTAKHRAEHHGHPYYFCSNGCRTKFEAEPDRYLDPASAAAKAEPVPAGHDLHLPDAPPDPPGRPRILPDLRHGPGAGDGERGRRPERRNSST